MANTLSITTTAKTFDQACQDLEQACKTEGYGVLGHHDIGKTLRSKGIAFGEECRIYEICQPFHASAILGIDLSLSTSLPCRISVYTENGVTCFGMVNPHQLLSGQSDDPRLEPIARLVQQETSRILELAR